MWRFRRSIRLLPGVKLNIAKTGPSLSIGRHGYTVNVRGRRIKQTVSLPGTGLSASRSIAYGRTALVSWTNVGWLVFFVCVIAALGWLMNGIN